jgi:glycine cleavage system H protein
MSGEIVEVNGELEDDPELVNKSPTGEGWFMKIRLSDASELDGMMDEAAYNDFASSQG